MFEAVERGVQRPLLNFQAFLRNLLDPQQNAVTVQGAQGDRFQDQHVEGSLQKIELFFQGALEKQLDLLQGTLDMLILKAISLSPLHGYGILLRIQQISKERLEIQQGSLYPALYRLEHHGWITSEWGESENNRRARYYRLTAAGKRQLQSETERWNQMSAVISGILRATPEEL